MKSLNFVPIVIILIGAFYSCNKENIKSELLPNNPKGTYSFNGRDTIDCGSHDALEYDLNSMFYNHEFLTLDTIFKIEVGDSIYNWLYYQMRIVDSIGFKPWYYLLFGQYPSSDVLSEIEKLQDLIDDNFSGRFYSSLVDSLVDTYVDNDRLTLIEKNLLSVSALQTSTYWELSKCNNNNFEVRGGDDDHLCDYPEGYADPGCFILEAGPAIYAGVAAGQWIADHTQLTSPDFNIDGWLPVIAGVISFFFINNNDPLNCYGDCDDCHHPVKIVLKADYFRCNFSAAQWFGNFEFAQAWEYNVNVHSGNFNGTVFESRTGFPLNFDPNGLPFTVTVRTLCDGNHYPDNNSLGFSQIFSNKIPPTPLSIRGAIIVNHEDSFRYKSSTSFGGNLSNPIWDVSDGVEILSSGTENGSYFIVVDFSNVTTSTADITLSVFDDCSNSTISTTFPARLHHE